MTTQVINPGIPSDSQFIHLAKAVHGAFNQLSGMGELFYTGINGYKLAEEYLASFPEGTDPIFRVRTHHDCSMDKSVIRKIGNVVAIVDGRVYSFWGLVGELPYPYNVVAKRLNELVLAEPIVGPFYADVRKVGIEYNTERLASGDVITWNHFFADIPEACYKPYQIGKLEGEVNTTIDQFRRGMEEISIDALDTFLDLIDGGLYRGEEFRDLVNRVKAMKSRYDGTVTFLYANYKDYAVSKFISNVGGTLVSDIMKGVDLEEAVKNFEFKVDPTNFQRTTAIITPVMVQKAMGTINELGVESALERRHARVSDVTVNNVIWADGKVKQSMKGGVEALLMGAAQTKGEVGYAEDIAVEDFVHTVIPQAVHMEVLLSNNHVNNLVSITAPVHADAPRLFKWDNGFGWSYHGDITDSIRERVKKAGGNVDAEFRVSLSWYNKDDLDLHCQMQRHGYDRVPVNVYFNNKMDILDVDMNRGDVTLVRDAVENMSFRKVQPMDAVFFVNNYARRETADVGFEIEVFFRGNVEHYRYRQAVGNRDNVPLFRYRYSADGTLTQVEVNPALEKGLQPKSIWGVQTESFVPVQMVMNSPNYWDGQATGNRHLFFILEGLRNDQPTRGIFNEFLRPELVEHRKVFEVLANKTKCEVADQQLSGLGFSSTIRKSVTVKVDNGTSVRRYNVNF